MGTPTKLSILSCAVDLLWTKKQSDQWLIRISVLFSSVIPRCCDEELVGLVHWRRVGPSVDVVSRVSSQVLLLAWTQSGDCIAFPFHQLGKKSLAFILPWSDRGSQSDKKVMRGE